MILPWQSLGDIMKIVSWPIAFVLLAARQRRTYVASIIFAMTVFIGLAAALVPVIDIQATGLAFIGMYAV